MRDYACGNNNGIDSGLLSRQQALPAKVPAHRTKGGLLKEGGQKLMVLDEVDLGLLDGTTPSVESHGPILRQIFLLDRNLGIWGAKV